MKQFNFIFAFIIYSISAFPQEFLNKNDYNRLFNHMKSCPLQIEEDPEPLFNYLRKEARNDRELIEIIFYWIADNISYDIEEFKTGKPGISDGLSVLKARKSVCQGYTDLFKLFCTFGNIECEIISGYAKGFGYKRIRYSEPNHTWNAVKLDGAWKLVDVTWGSGYGELDHDTLLYKKKMNLNFLFSKPEGFIIRHFPVDPKWQLLDNPISLDEFYSKKMDEKIINENSYLK